MGYSMFSVMDTLFPILFFGIFALVVITFIVVLARGASQWRRNNASPVLVREAKVLDKRMEVGHTGGSGNAHGHSYTQYYVTFEAEGERVELQVTGREYGMLAAGDWGDLTNQGTRYKGFERR